MQVLGPNHFYVATTLDCIANLKDGAGQVEEAPGSDWIWQDFIRFLEWALIWLGGLKSDLCMFVYYVHFLYSCDLCRNFRLVDGFAVPLFLLKLLNLPVVESGVRHCSSHADHWKSGKDSLDGSIPTLRRSCTTLLDAET